MQASQIPVTLVTGYLGAGKTTLILNLIKQLPDDYQVVWLKNEYGDANVDGLLAHESNIKVTEILNGCLCCVLVGRLGDAVKEILEKYRPARIILESSGTAYPLPLVLELGRIPEVSVDGVITVIDALNFAGYRDKSAVARLQNEVVDLIVINKVSLVDDLSLDKVLDDVLELNPATPLVKTPDGNVSKDLLIGLDAKSGELEVFKNVTSNTHNLEHESGLGNSAHHPDEVDTFTWRAEGEVAGNQAFVEQLFQNAKQKELIRIKGVLNFTDGAYMFNWVYGRGTFTALPDYHGGNVLLFMARKGAAGWQQYINETVKKLVR